MPDISQAIVEVQMMIRKPVSEVFQAFINPDITTKFWFTKSSGPLKEGRTVTWEWEMYGAAAEIQVMKIIPNKEIVIQWDEPATIVEFLFNPVKDSMTYVIIKNYGFHQKGMELIEAIKNNTGGFTTVLDGLKAYLEYGIQLNLVRDKFLTIDKT